MSESTLSLKRSDLLSDVGLFLGWGRGSDAGDRAWTTREEAILDQVVRSGLRQFYFPPPVENGPAYSWSFLRPTTSVTLASAANTIDMPADFGGIEGQMSVSQSNTIHRPVPIINEGRVRQLLAENPNSTGDPQVAAIRPLKGPNADRGQRFQLYVYPTADQEYTLEFQYYLLPEALDGTNEYAYGGMQHAETILESCLAIAEQRLDDASSVHSMKFHERLMASIAVDRQKKAQWIGYNSDRSDSLDVPSRHDRFWNNSPVTVNGVQY